MTIKATTSKFKAGDLVRHKLGIKMVIIKKIYKAIDEPMYLVRFIEDKELKTLEIHEQELEKFRSRKK